MAYTVEVTLSDAAGKDPEGSGSWQVIFRRNGSVVHDTAALNYIGAALSVTTPIGADWTHATVRIAPNLYALQGGNGKSLVEWYVSEQHQRLRLTVS